MISRRTSALMAATIIAFVASQFYSPATMDGWDISEAGRPHENWIAVGIICAAGSAVSVLIDIVIRRKRP